MSGPVLKFKRLSPTAVAPIRATPNSEGFDLASPRDTEIPANNWITLFLGIAIELPPGTYGRIAPRSGLAAWHGITVDAGLIEPDFRGNVGIVLVNRSKRPYKIHEGERIAQLICEKFEASEVEEISALERTKRGNKGFGSTLNWLRKSK